MAEAVRLVHYSDEPLADALAVLQGYSPPDAADLGLKLRIHGDYHLGQALRTQDGWVLLDFEGEPARPVQQRRERHHPLADVAGMLRSWSYAAETLAAEREGSAGVAKAWEDAMRRAFLDAYWRAAEGAEPRFLPHEQSERDALLEMFELRKALYEVLYELNNRPGWARIPASAVVRLAGEA